MRVEHETRGACRGGGRRKRGKADAAVGETIERVVARALDACTRRAPLHHILVAVSGGADSTALLHILCGLAAKRGLRVSCGHLDHGLRAESPADACFVRELAAGLGVALECGSAAVRRVAAREGESLEMAARRCRYRFLAAAARRAGASVVATGHTGDDEAETVLLRLARGAGPAGLGGIAADIELCGVRVVRPLLGATHEQAVAWLRTHGLAWREDASNRDPGFLRNRVRAEVLPLLESRLNPAMRRVLVRTAAIMRAENDWLSALAADILSRCREDGAGDSPGILNLDRLRRHPAAACRRVLRLWLDAAGIPSERVPYALIDRIEQLARTSHGSAGIPVDGRMLVRRYGRLSLEDARDAVPPSAYRAACRIPGETLLPDCGLRVTTRRQSGITRPPRSRVGCLPATASLNGAAVGRRRLYVRSWRPGDRMRPLGFDGSKKLQDIFTDAKVPRAQRGRVPVFECAGQIVWVPGYRIAEGWQVPSRDAAAVRITVERI